LPALSPSAQASTWRISSAVDSRRTRSAPAHWRPVTALTAVLIGLIAGQGIAVSLVETSGHTRAVLALGLVVSDLILLAAVVAFAARGAERLGAATFGIRRTRWGAAIGWGLTLLFAGIAVEGLIAATFGMGGGGSSGVQFSAGTAVLVALGVAVTAPLAEEIAFRGYLFPALTTWRGPWLAATITAVLFGAAHFAALPAPMLLGAAFFGFGTCMLFWFTGSLLPCVAVHSINNALALTFLTEGQLAPAILFAPLLSMLLLFPFARERAPADSPL
jgi:membrane protease YdiL (CAAX protease family)